ncbi:hypothetical protein [Dapis sp. BLCC M126]|uniref:hypothetical protein n=1 Tax=Dapis sp. BLCC M126 TaxID=3400189 RepID=UPI003CF84657
MSGIKFGIFRSTILLVALVTIFYNGSSKAINNESIVYKNNYFQLSQASSIENLQEIIGKDTQV